MHLIDFIRGRLPGLSDEEERGRKELVWIGASAWITPILMGLKEAGQSSIDGATLAVLGLNTLVNLALLSALAKGQGWARGWTLYVMGGTALVSLALLGGAGGPAVGSVPWLTGLLNGVVLGGATVILWKSKSIRAYLESQQEAGIGILRNGVRAPQEISAPNAFATMPGTASSSGDAAPAVSGNALPAHREAARER